MHREQGNHPPSGDDVYRQVVENAPDPIFVADLVTDNEVRLAQCNRAWVNAVGFSRGPEGRRLEEVLPPDQASRLLAACQQCAATGAAVAYEEDLCTGGAHRRFHTTLTPLRDAQGGVIRMFGVSRDITALTSVENVLREREQAYRAVVEHSVDTVARVDRDGRYIFANLYLQEILGQSLPRLVGRTPLEAGGGVAELVPLQRLIAQVTADGHEAELELALTHQDGRIVHERIHLVPEFGADGQVDNVLLIGRDIRVLRDTERQLETLMDNFPDFLVRIGINHRHIYVNPAVSKAFGLPQDEFLGKTLDELPHGADREQNQRLKEAIARAFAEGRPNTVETRWVVENELHIFEVRHFPEYDAGGRVVSVLGIARDITALKKAEVGLKRFNRALKTLSSGNETLVRATDEETLLAGMCRTVVQEGGYCLSWVGRVDTEGQLVPTAWSDGADLLDVEVLSALCAAPGDPSLRAAQSGEIQVNHDLANDPAFVERDAAFREHLRSCLALPLKNGEGVVGVLSIYSSDAGAFDDEETRLFAELADDLSFGIHALRVRAEREQGIARLQQSMEATIQALASTAELRDPYTAGHQRRVAELAVAIAREMKLSDHRIHGLYLAAVVHDVGKINVPSEILTKPGRLTQVEYELVKGHVEAGYEILKSIDFPWPISSLVHQHHERLDGSGYPLGLTGEAILLEARILAVADVVETMSTHRPYRASLGMQAAIKTITEARGTKFDPGVVDACVRLFEENRFQFDNLVASHGYHQPDPISFDEELDRM